IWSAVFLSWLPLSLKVPSVIMLLLLVMVYWLLLCRRYLRRECVFQNFRYLKRSAFFYFLTGGSPQHLVYLLDAVQLLQYKVACPITVQKSYHPLALCKFCHRFIDLCTFYCNGIIITCAEKIDYVCPSFHQYYPVRVKDSSAAGKLCFAKACKLARLACIINVFEHFFSLTYCSCSPVLHYLPGAVNYDLLLYSSNVIDSN